jgi:hypothetical protein
MDQSDLNQSPLEIITELDHRQETLLIELSKQALIDARICRGKLPPDLLLMHGMSGRKYRYFINNLIGSMPDARYLEIGTWAGSTLCSAIYGNTVTAFAVDNWSEFGAPVTEFFRGLSYFASETTSISFVTSDFRKVPYGQFGKFNVYFFDGPHSEHEQYLALQIVQDALDDEFVFIVDDWNWEAVRKGTRDAIRDTGLRVSYEIEIRTSLDETHPEVRMEKSDWHNGYYIAVLSKKH